jgi:serine/threonine protein kinase
VSATELEFTGTERFEVVRRLGMGGMGAVYLAHDRQRDARVALKLLRQVDPLGIYRFKREFRALANVSHPNLVALDELVSRDDRWFFTMEVVDGVDFLVHIRGRPDAPSLASGSGDATQTETTGSATLDTIITGGSALGLERGIGAAHTPLVDAEQYDRLRRALRQLTEGVLALHQAGHLHRDIKPSNVLVTEAGRVVLLDFGVVAELAGERYELGPRSVVGTPAYMAPEQGRDGPLSAACDWYAVGVMLYEALVGRRPFAGSMSELMEAKHTRDAFLPAAVRASAPADLAALCTGLLARDPEGRTSGAELLRTLGGDPESHQVFATVPSATTDEALLVGRESHLQALDAALADVRSGRPRTVLISGPSGCGKTALCDRFLRRLRHDDRAVVLTGRCYERESVPYKAVDNLIDALYRAPRRSCLSRPLWRCLSPR